MTLSTAEPRYLRICNELQKQIANGELPAGKRLPKVEELCAKHKVSSITVRRAMSMLADDGTVRRVPGCGTFVADTGSKNMKTASRTISLVFANLYGCFPSAIITGIESVIREAGYKTQIYVSEDNYGIEREHVKQLINEGPAGIILFGVCRSTINPNCDIFLAVKARGIPLVLVDTFLPSLDLDHVVSADFDGSYAIAEHFINSGHREIGYVRLSEKVSSIEARFAGFQKAMADNDLPVRSKYVISVGNISDYRNFGVQSCEQLVRHIRGLKDDLPTAFLCYTDGMAFSLYRALREVGIKMPQDVAIGGFGGGYEAEMFPVPLTTVIQPTEEVGVRAAQLLLERINHSEDNSNTQHIALPTKLIVGSSCVINSDRHDSAKKSLFRVKE